MRRNILKANIKANKGILLILLVFLLFFSLLIAHACHYMPFLSDDSLISLRYAQRLLQGKGLTWTEGRPVEGYSNLLWVLLVALLGIFRIDLINAARILGILGMGTVILSVLVWYAHSTNGRDGARPSTPPKNIWPAVMAGLLFFSLAGPAAVWAIGGLEQPLLAALLSVAIPLCWLIIEDDSPNPNTTLTLWASLVLGLMCLTRLDGLIFTAAAILAVGIGRRISNRPWSWSLILRLALFPVLFLLGQMAFRLYFYGEIIPNTALVKIVPSGHHLLHGLVYAGRGMIALTPVSILVMLYLLFCLIQWRKQPRMILLMVMLAIWIPYLIFIGGDIFPAFRHFIPVVVMFTFVLVEAVDRLWTFLRYKTNLRYKTKSHEILTFIILAALFVPFVLIQFKTPRNQDALNERWEWDGKVLGLLLNKAFSHQKPLLAVTAAGCLPYWSELPCLDMLGLNDYYLPRHRPQDIGQGYLGHELGDGRYILSRKPDIICFYIGSREAIFRSGIEMQKTEEFYKLYTPVCVRGTVPYEYTGTLWFLKYSEKIGLRKTPQMITVPGFLLNASPQWCGDFLPHRRDACAASPHTVACLDGGCLVSSIQAGKPLEIKIEGIDHEQWAIEVRGDHPEKIKSHLTCDGTSLKVILTTESELPLHVKDVILTPGT